jgi:RNA polymerase sigma-70 factor, ECF subfamily
MSMSQTITSEFDIDLKALLPRLRIYAMSLTRDRDRADDLVQQTAMKALIGRKSFRSGSDFASWLFRIQRNEFISGLRRLRPTVPFDNAVSATLAYPPHQENGLIMREFLAAFRRLSASARQVLLLSVLEGYSHSQIAEHSAISVGTVKSRLWRARLALEQLLGSAPRSRRSEPDTQIRHVLKSGD